MTHEQLLKVVVRLPEDYLGFGSVERESDDDFLPDCSSGCRHYALLMGKLGEDWGVCTSLESHRSGLLTFEHQGCPQFEEDPEPAQTLHALSQATLEVLERMKR